MRVVLISTYELGRQPFGLASPAAWLRAAGADVICLDLAVAPAALDVLDAPDLIAFYLPMHTATRLATAVIPRLRAAHPRAHLCAYGLYAPPNAPYLQRLGVATILGGEFEAGLVTLLERLRDAAPAAADTVPHVSLDRQRFLVPARDGLPALTAYAGLRVGDERRLAGYTEASRGCRHTCNHCPIVPVYNGRFRIVQRDVVLADIAQQVAAGADHITFGDPDFLNGPGHALPIVEALHARFPDLTYDVTIKIEHLRRYERLLPRLRDTGCLTITSAVEAVDDDILAILDKGHTMADFVAVADRLRRLGLVLNPTFVAFNPWISAAGYLDLLAAIDILGLVEHVAPVQYAIRLLLPAGSPLLARPDVQAIVSPFDEAALYYPWRHPDMAVDALYETIYGLVRGQPAAGQSRAALFATVWAAAEAAAGETRRRARVAPAATAVPIAGEDWY